MNEMYTMHKILSSLEISDEIRGEILGSLLDSHAGGFSTIRPGMMRRAFDEGARQHPVDGGRAYQLDPDMNRAYRLLQEALEGCGDSESALLKTIGPLALCIRKGDCVHMELEPYSDHEMARAAVTQLQRDTGDSEQLCTLRCRLEGADHLLALWYPASGILAAAAGISQKTVTAVDVPWLAWTGERAYWRNPMPHLSADEAARLIFMLERLYPEAQFPGMGGFMKAYGSCLDAARRQRLARQIHVRFPYAVADYLGKAAAEALTVPGAPIPEVFTDRLPVMRMEADRPMKGRLCSVIALGQGKIPMLVLPPLHQAILDDPNAAIEQVRLASTADKKLEVTAALRYDGEPIERKRIYAWSDLIDLSAAPAILQHFHMQGVSDEMWNGRCLLVSEAVRPSRLDLEPICDIPIAAFGPIDRCILPDGSAEVKRHLLHSSGGAWAVYRTGKQTRYVTLTDSAGTPIVHLLTEEAEASWEHRRYEGKGLLAFDIGATTAHVAAVLDDAQGLQAPMLNVEFKAREMAQPIGPMAPHTFEALCRLCGQTDFTGPLHPTILEHFRTSDSPAELESPGIGTRLAHLTAENLVEIGEGSYDPADLSINMKADAGSGKAESQRATKAYTMALASFMQLGYLWMLSHGQDKVQLLVAYPKGVKSAAIYDKAVQYVGRSLPRGTNLRHKLMAESAAAGTYIRVTQPEGLPIHGGSDLAVIDIGGSTTDIDVSRKGSSLRSGSFAYAANLFQLSALLALLRKPHEGARARWNSGTGMDILRGIFSGGSGELTQLGSKLSRSAAEAMAKGKTPARRQITSEIDRKRLEQLFRNGTWAIDPADSLTQHWLQLWSLPIFALLADNLRGLEDGAVFSAMVGAGSIYLEGLLQSDSGFRSRVDRWIVERSGVRAHKMVFTGSHQKPEVARGMLMAELRGCDGTLPEENAAAVPIDPHAITLEDYHAFVARLAADGLVAPEAEPDDSYGLASVYDLLVYTPATLDGFDDFASIVSDVAERFPDTLLCGKADLLLYMIAFDVAVRNLLGLQLQA